MAYFMYVIIVGSSVGVISDEIARSMPKMAFWCFLFNIRFI